MASGSTSLMPVLLLGGVAVGAFLYVSRCTGVDENGVKRNCFGQPGGGGCTLDADCNAPATCVSGTCKTPGGGGTCNGKQCTKSYCLNPTTCSCDCNRVCKNCQSPNGVAAIDNGNCVCKFCPPGTVRNTAGGAMDSRCIKAPGSTGTSGNCTFNVPKGQFTWKGTYQACQNGKTVILQNSKSVNCPGCSQAHGCDVVRTSWLQSFHNTPCPAGCTKEYVKCPGGCCCNPVVKACSAAQITTLVNGNCRCLNCKPGFKRGGNGNQCVPIGGNVSCQPCYVSSGGVCKYNPGSGAAWIARVVNAMLGRMLSKPATIPSIAQIASGWSSLTTQCAVDNSCNLNKLHSSYSVFNRHFAQLLLAIANSYKSPLTVLARGALNTQFSTGVWQLAQWGGGVAGFYARRR